MTHTSHDSYIQIKYLNAHVPAMFWWRIGGSCRAAASYTPHTSYDWWSHTNATRNSSCVTPASDGETGCLVFMQRTHTHTHTHTHLCEGTHTLTHTYTHTHTHTHKCFLGTTMTPHMVLYAAVNMQHHVRAPQHAQRTGHGPSRSLMMRFFWSSMRFFMSASVAPLVPIFILSTSSKSIVDARSSAMRSQSLSWSSSWASAVDRSSIFSSDSSSRWWTRSAIVCVCVLCTPGIRLHACGSRGAVTEMMETCALRARGCQHKHASSAAPAPKIMIDTHCFLILE